MANSSLRVQAKEDNTTELRIQQDEASMTTLEQQDEEKRPRKRAKRNTRKASPEDYQPPKSNSKKSRMPAQFRNVRGKLGLLEKLAKDVPLDIILEIFCYLDPGDLLRLARTTKELRALLMSKSSENIWRTARENIEGLPPRPNDLNEPQYADLLYESYCHICNQKSRRCTVFWSFRVRACKNCAETASRSFPSRVHPDLRASQPLDYHSIYGDLPLEILRGRWSAFACHSGIAERYKAEYKALQTLEDRSAWVRRKKQELLEIVKHGDLCQAWLNGRQYGRASELEGIRSQRKEAILVRLGELGWRKEAETANEFPYHKLVRQTKKLTERGWNSIQTELVQWLSDRKAKRIVSKRYNLVATEYVKIRSTDPRQPSPEAGKILSDKIFDDLVWETSFDEEVSSDLVQEKLAEHLPRIFDDWKSAKIQELINIVQKTRPGATALDLQLATIVFKCTRCYDQQFYYPQMFYHQCCFTKLTVDGLNEERIKIFDFSSLYGVWNSETLALSEEGSRIANEIIEACGLDPATATIQDLNTANPLIECITCHQRQVLYNIDRRVFMRWPCAIGNPAHHSQHTFAVNSFGDKTNEILACESYDHRQGIVCCAHCHQQFDGRKLVKHLQTTHSDTISNVDKLKVSRFKPNDLREHWYWDPRYALSSWCQEFSYEKPVDTAT